MITAIDRGKNNLLGFTMGGKLTDEDYRKFIAIFEPAIASSGKISLLVQFEDFHLWDLGAA
ncbi:MAG: STAS/SEC14 domain-containing protein [Verrucomicrobia bacterium]|nr:STAS/SEC14 domain-containing protein [Verrucomicrobiota bacterium]